MIRIRRVDVEELLLRYVQAAQGYEQGLSEASSKEADKHHSVAERIFKELQRRGVERELIPLLSHPRPIVRLWAAVHVLKFDPEHAKPVLEKLARSGSGVPKLDAIDILEIWNERTSSK